MGIRTIFKEKQPRIINKEDVAFYVSTEAKLKEALKDLNRFQGEVERKVIRFPAELGEEHPFNYETTEKLYATFGFQTAIVNRYVNMIWGGGVHTKCEDERAKEIIDQWIKDVDFDSLGRHWTKQGLLNCGFLELGGKKDETVQGAKVLGSRYMFVKRDEKGHLEKVNQYKGGFDKFAKDKVLPFDPHQVAILALNKVGDCPYGLGIVYPMIRYIDDFISLRKDMHFLTKRKANSPYHAKLGDKDNRPTMEAVESFGKKLETMSGKTEWATDDLVDINVLDFGKVGEKFEAPLRQDFEMIMISSMLPEIALGLGNIPEGLADKQDELLDQMVASFQIEIEKVVENKIFRRILQSHNLDVHVELEWGQPDKREKNERVTRLTEALKLFNLSPTMVKMLEDDMAVTLGYDIEKLQVGREEDEERKKEEEEPQPKVPGTKAREFYQSESCASHKHIKEETDYSLREWLGFNYRDYLSSTLDIVEQDAFTLLLANSNVELAAGKFTSVQVGNLREVMYTGFQKGQSIREISSQINEKVKPKDLLKLKDGKIVRDRNGLAKLQVSKEKRAIMISRTETTRLANLGALDHYKKEDVEKVRWVASTGGRTCPECIDLNGKIFEIDKVIPPPIHVMCRCTTIPITELSESSGYVEKEFTCECIECGNKVKSSDHCKNLKCAKCGGKMRRITRPGPGR